MQNVLAGRALQVQELEAERVKEQLERKREVDELKADWRRYLQELDHEKAQKVQKQLAYRADLDSQMQYLSTIHVCYVDISTICSEQRLIVNCSMGRKIRNFLQKSNFLLMYWCTRNISFMYTSHAPI